MESDFGIVNVVAMFETDIIRQYAFISITDISKQFMYIMRGSYSFNIILCLLTCIIQIGQRIISRLNIYNEPNMIYAIIRIVMFLLNCRILIYIIIYYYTCIVSVVVDIINGSFVQTLHAYIHRILNAYQPNIVCIIIKYDMFIESTYQRIPACSSN